MAALPFLLSAVLLAIAQGPGADSIAGIVRDATGDVVAGATVIVRDRGAEYQAITRADGRFDVALPAGLAGPVTIVVRAPGFAEARTSVRPAPDGTVEIVLDPAGLSEIVTVTALRTEQRLRDVPASVNVVTREDIRRSPAMVADDLLRQVPTFSLFRRTSSLAAHPTAQGVSLRGIGPSGVSRTLVLLDGVPFNDPFGGWVYWTRVPLGGTERIEVVDSSSSSLYGNYAMGGVINILTAPATRRTIDMRAQYGSRNTPKLDVRASDVWGNVGITVDGAVFDTDGYPIVVETNPAGQPERGLVDKNASVSFQTFNVKMDYTPSPRVQAFVRSGYFREERVNGKATTIVPRDEANDTRWFSASGGVRVRTARQSDVQASVFTDIERFRSNFMAVPAATPPRSVGRMTLEQTVPSRSAGGMFQWSRALGGRHFVTAGADGRWVDGDSEENALDAVTGTTVVLRRISGGTQRSVGLFAQDVIAVLPRLTVTVSARADNWRNYNAHNLETDVLTGAPAPGHNPSLPDRSDTVASPRVAGHYQLTPRVSVWGSLGTGFRAPTLNELYRQFRVGTVLTLANHQLGPERLVGGEAGLTLMPWPNVMVRTTWFDNRIEDPVSNITIAAVGPNVTQQRQNLGRTHVRGIQTDGELRVGTALRLTGGYMYERAQVTEFPANPALVGNVLPQVPRHRGAFQVIYANPRYVDLALAVHAGGRQFDDDLNVRAVPGISVPGLPGYGVASLTASRLVSRGVEAFVGVQNLFDREYFVGTLPTTIGTPRLVSGGIRVRLSGR
jgi:outer membrane receptor protein involved in Fe transport